ncbi:MAG: hypothetical protein QOD06_3430 [Candidatus Binatota bacterium]|nr:hypothetical protein [Candidatus Binatota bacterium]
MPDERNDPPDPFPEGEEERFYRGKIVRLQYGRRTGILRTGNGREVPFAETLVEILDGRRFEDLVEGMEVGFDVGWTSRGLRVTKIKP